MAYSTTLPTFRVKPDSYFVRSSNKDENGNRFLEIPGNEDQLPSFLEGSLYSLLEKDIVAPEYDEILFNIYKYLDNLVPNLLDYQYILTEEEINSAFVAVGALLGYKPNYKFLGKWSESFIGSADQNLTLRKRKELEWRIADLYSISIRRKLFGSYIGYKLLFTSLRRHGSVYLVGNYGSSIMDKNYKRQFRIIDLEQADHFVPYNPALKTDYPVTGYLEGYTDVLYYKNKYLAYDTGLSLDQASATDIDKFLTYDSYNPIVLDKTVFLDITLDRILVHKNRLGTSSCLLDLDWLEFIQSTAQDTKRVSEKIKIGSQLTLITDSSGFYTKIDSPYTHPNTHAKVFVFNQTYVQNSKPGKIAIGIGGKIKDSWFKSIVDLSSVPIFGDTSLYDSQPFVDPTQLQSAVIIQQDTTGGFILENQLFEMAIDKNEIIENAVGDFDLIHATIQSETIKDAFKPDIFMTILPENNDLSRRDNSQTFDLHVKDIESEILGSTGDHRAELSLLQTSIFTQRTSITKGSLDIKFILKPYVFEGQYPFVKTIVDGETKFKVNGVQIEIDNIDKFIEDFWLDDVREDVNPLWQYVEIKDIYDYSAKSWSQRLRILKRVKVVTSYSSYYDYEDITGTDEAYVNISKGFTYVAGPPEAINKNTTYIDYQTGMFTFIAFNNQSYETIVDGYLPLRQDYQTNPYLKFTKICDNSLNWYSIRVSTPFKANNIEFFSTFKVSEATDLTVYKDTWGSDMIANYITNTTQNIADSSDSESAIVAITEMGIFNTSGNLMLYSTFPPIIYDSLKNHLSFNVFIKKTPIIVT